MRKISTIVYFIHMYAWTGYYMLVYGTKTYGIDTFIATSVISVLISGAWILIKSKVVSAMQPEKLNEY